ncbi:fluoride efflux transporter CrcB [soil metagenome]
MRDVILVFLGGGVGSVVRFSLSKWINTFHSHPFPWGTLVVNVVACFALGLIIGLADHKQIISPAARLFWTVGFCGGFSTFSTFSSETLTLLQGGLTATLILYISLSLIICVTATYGGLFLGEM